MRAQRTGHSGRTPNECGGRHGRHDHPHGHDPHLRRRTRPHRGRRPVARPPPGSQRSAAALPRRQYLQVPAGGGARGVSSRVGRVRRPGPTGAGSSTPAVAHRTARHPEARSAQPEGSPIRLNWCAHAQRVPTWRLTNGRTVPAAVRRSADAQLGRGGVVSVLQSCRERQPCQQCGAGTTGSDVVGLEDFIAVVVGDLDRDPAGIGPGEPAAHRAVEAVPDVWVDVGLQCLAEALVRVVAAV